MAENTVLNVTNLDFTDLKENFVEFLKGQDEFKDYDFTGSALNILLDVLAYNTQYQAYYLNMMANEMFLDSAQLRSSVVSKAKHLNYLPRSVKAATAHVDIEVFPFDNPSAVVVNKNSRFIGKIGQDSYSFVPDKAYTIPRKIINGKAVYKRKGIVLKQGDLLSYKWTVNTNNPNQKFVIPNPNVDTTTLSVRVQSSANSTKQEFYTLAKDTNRISGEDNVYYLQEVEDGLFEIYFGDGILGKQLENNNIIHVDYIATAGDKGNHASTFSLQGSLNGYSDVNITTTMKSMGGDERETIESIKFHAPKTFEGQNRAVTARDYKTVIPKIFPNIQSMNIWGGEDNDPPFYGRVMIAINPENGYYLSDAVKNEIEKQLVKEWSVVSITPMIVDPDYTHIQLDLTVKFDEMKTVLTSEDIHRKVIEAVEKYDKETLSKFESYFRYSKFLTTIDNVDPSITNNLTKVKMKKSVVPTLYTNTYYELKFNNPIEPKTLSTSYFDVGNQLVEGAIPNKRYFKDDGAGNIDLNIVIGGKEQTLINNIGSINYETGLIKIHKLKVNWFDGKAIDFYVVPQKNDVMPLHNQIISLDLENLSVSVLDDTDIG